MRLQVLIVQLKSSLRSQDVKDWKILCPLGLLISHIRTSFFCSHEFVESEEQRDVNVRRKIKSNTGQTIVLGQGKAKQLLCV